MYKRSTDGRDKMRRQYNPPPTYGGSRFIRATHGVRGLEDNELAAHGDRVSMQERREQRRTSPHDNRRGVADREELLPDFEYYGNILSDGSEPHSRDGYDGRVVESERSREQRRMAEDEYRDSPAPVDRFGHDYNMSSFPVLYDFGGDSDRRGLSDEDGWDDRDDGVSRDCAHGMCSEREGYDGSERSAEHTGNTECTECAENADSVRSPDGGDRTRRPMPRRGMFRSARPIGALRKGHTSAQSDDGCEACAAADTEQKPHPLLNFSVEEGDLLLLVLLALLAGEDGCADLVATLALLLMIRQN